MPAGRPKGAKGKAVVAREAAIATLGMTPLDYMLQVMLTADTPAMKLDAAKAAAPYCHPKLMSTELTGKDGGDIRATITVGWMTEAEAKDRGLA